MSPTTSSDRPDLGARLGAGRQRGRRALIPYLTAGYPDPADTLPLLRAFAEAGADVLELGVPFSDPLADGPTIQAASQRALENGVTLPGVLEVLDRFRGDSDVPVVLFSYLNPVLGYGVGRFIADALSAGADGVLLTDLPVGADPALEERLERSPLALVRLVAPTTPKERARLIAARSQGFLYYVSRTGVTGARQSVRSGLEREVAELRKDARVPVAVGFGISTPEQAARIGRVADGVVVGSALIDALDRDGPEAAVALLAGMRSALDAAAGD